MASDGSRGHHFATVHLHDNSRALLGNINGSNGLGSIHEIMRGTNSSHEFTFPGIPKILGQWPMVIPILQKFKAINRDVKIFGQSLVTHRAIFIDSIRTMLILFLDAGLIDDMISNTENWKWKDADLCQHIQRVFCGSTYGAITVKLQQLLHNLEHMQDFSEKLNEAYMEMKSAMITPLDVIIARFSETTKLLIDEAEAQLRVESIKADVCALQSILLNAVTTRHTYPATDVSESTKHDLQRFRLIQAAAKDVYDGFGLACKSHSSHEANLGLKVNCQGNRAQFRLALTPSNGSIMENSVSVCLRLTIESNLGQDCRQTASYQITKRKRCDEDAGESRKYFVHEQDPGKSARNLPRIFNDHLEKMASNDLPNFCTDSNFCEHATAILKQTTTIYRALGYLDLRTGSSKHLIFLRPHSSSINVDTHSGLKTLQELRKGHNNRLRLTKVERANLAKQCALAVLQYHTTPWLDGPWDSKNLLLEEVSGSSSSEPDLESYLSVSIRGKTRADVHSTASKTFIRNSVLFKLAVMLVELAFKKPLRTMQSVEDIQIGDPLLSDYYTAKRLQRLVSAKMGVAYAKVIDRCLHCDFGHGNDLATSRLQEAFYQDAVQPLNSLADKLANIYIEE